MAFYIDSQGRRHDVPATIDLYKEASEKGVSVAQLVNTKFNDVDATPDLKLGNVFQQACASEGLVLVGSNPFGARSPMLADIFEGRASYSAAANTTGRSTPFGTESRTLFPAAVIQMIEDSIQPDRTTDDAIFRSMVKLNQSIGTDTFAQPVISYAGAGGANNGTNGARAQRITQLGGTPMMLRLTTADRFSTLPTYGIGIEMSEQAMKATSLDLMVMTVNRFTQIEKDARVYSYLASLFAGDADQNTSAVSAVTTTSLDAAASGGVITHKAWVKFLARNRKKRKITHVVADIDTYLKVEGRTGRPGTTNYDPTLARIDPQAQVANNTFGGDVIWFIVDDAANGGPVPANTIWALDKEQAIMMVQNTSADYKATEAFVLKRSEAMVWHWGESVFRLFSNTDLTPFDVLTIA
jgi:hypothetical protein